MAAAYWEARRSLEDALYVAIQDPADPTGAVRAVAAQNLPELEKWQRPSPTRVRDGMLVTEALRSVMARLVAEAAEAEMPVMHYRRGSGDRGNSSTGEQQPLAPALLNAAMGLADSGYVEMLAFMTLIEDMVDSCTTSDCGDVFTYLESKQGDIRPGCSALASTHPKLSLLRFCNQLLRRLIKTTDSALCGRVLIFMAKTFQVGDRSGTNINSLVNTEHSVRPEEVGPDERDVAGQPIDAELYRRFWGLQRWLQQPRDVVAEIRVANKGTTNNFATFSADVQYVLESFAKLGPPSVYADSRTTAAAASGSSTSTTATTSSSAADTVASRPAQPAQFLVSPKLFNLQLRDADFRKTFLVQCLILLQAITYTAINPAKYPPPDVFKPQPEAVLRSPDQRKAAGELKQQLMDALEAMPDNGPHAAGLMRDYLEVEKWWYLWKRPPPPADANKMSKEQLLRVVADRKAMDWYRPPLAELPVRPLPKRRPDANKHSALSEAWESTPEDANNVDEALRDLAAPPLEQYVDRILEAMASGEPLSASSSSDPDDQEYIKLYLWNLGRQIARKSMDAHQLYSTGRPEDAERAVAMLFPERVPDGWKQRDEARRAAAAADRDKKRKAAGGGPDQKPPQQPSKQLRTQRDATPSRVVVASAGEDKRAAAGAVKPDPDAADVDMADAPASKPADSPPSTSAPADTDAADRAAAAPRQLEPSPDRSDLNAADDDRGGDVPEDEGGRGTVGAPGGSGEPFPDNDRWQLGSQGEPKDDDPSPRKSASDADVDEPANAGLVPYGDDDDDEEEDGRAALDVANDDVAGTEDDLGGGLNSDTAAKLTAAKASLVAEATAGRDMDVDHQRL